MHWIERPFNLIRDLAYHFGLAVMKYPQTGEREEDWNWKQKSRENRGPMV